MAVVREMFEAFRRRDVDGVMRYLDEEVEVRLPVTGGAAGRREPYRGHAGVREYFDDVARVWAELEVEPIDYRSAAGSVVIFGRVHGRRHDGEPFEGGVLWTWKLRGGRIVSGAAAPTAAP